MNIQVEHRLHEIEKILDIFLPQNNLQKEWINASFGDLECDEFFFQNIIVPVKDILKRGGKRWRPLLCVLSCELAGAPPEKAYPLTPLIEFCHTASLIHDDIEDNSEVRRGHKAAHIKYGLDTALNAASWLYFHALTSLEMCSSYIYSKNEIYSLYSCNVRRLHLGQSMDIAWHSNTEYIPSIEDYCKMISLKTGSLAKMAGELGFKAAGRNKTEIEIYGRLMSDIGVAFQIFDDIKNITSGNAGKKRGDDIVEGKKSLPIIFYAEESSCNVENIKTWFTQAKKEGIASKAVDLCITSILESKAVQKAKNYGLKIMNKALDELKSNYNTCEAKQLILQLCNSFF